MLSRGFLHSSSKQARAVGLALRRRLCSKVVSSPNPDWSPDSKVKVGHDLDVVSLPSSNMKPVDCYKLMTSGIIPRPIAFISTLSEDGAGNIAPYSFFQGVSNDPPTVIFSVIGDQDRGKKDTLTNVEATGEFTVNTVAEWMAEAANHCSGSFPHGVSEWVQAGLTEAPSQHVKPPRCAESPFSMECTLQDVIPIRNDSGRETSWLVLGRVHIFHVMKACWDGDKKIVMWDKMLPASRLGRAYWGRTTEAYTLIRPQVRQPTRKISESPVHRYRLWIFVLIPHDDHTINVRTPLVAIFTAKPYSFTYCIDHYAMCCWLMATSNALTTAKSKLHRASSSTSVKFRETESAGTLLPTNI